LFPEEAGQEQVSMQSSYVWAGGGGGEWLCPGVLQGDRALGAQQSEEDHAQIAQSWLEVRGQEGKGHVAVGRMWVNRGHSVGEDTMQSRLGQRL
jgi:hypothetical protein